jgi:hypothetical protein
LHEGEKDNNAYNTKGGRKSVVPDEAEILYVQLVLYFLQATSEGNTIVGEFRKIHHPRNVEV